VKTQEKQSLLVNKNWKKSLPEIFLNPLMKEK